MPFKTLIFASLICGLVQASQGADGSTPVPGFPVGRCVKVLNIQSPEEAGPAGFEYLELAMPDLMPLSDSEFDDVVKRLKALPVRALSGYGFLPPDLVLVGPKVDQQRTREALRQGLKRARQLELKMVVFGNGLANLRKIPAGFSKAEALSQFELFCRFAAEEASRQGITLLIEPMLPSSTDLITTTAEGLVLVEKVNHLNFQMLVEYSIMVKGNEEMAILEKAAPHIRQIEIQNPNGWVYPKNADESDYASFFKALGKGHYKGSFSIHGKPTDVKVDAPVAIAMIRSLIREHLVP